MRSKRIMQIGTPRVMIRRRRAITQERGKPMESLGINTIKIILMDILTTTTEDGAMESKDKIRRINIQRSQIILKKVYQRERKRAQKTDLPNKLERMAVPPLLQALLLLVVSHLSLIQVLVLFRKNQSSLNLAKRTKREKNKKEVKF